MEDSKKTKRITWKPEVWDINKLKPYDKNPRIITEFGLDQLKASFDEIGMAQAININVDGTILSGHARWQQLKKENYSEVLVMVPDRKLTPKQEEAVIVRMNKNVAGQWDFDVLANEFEFEDLIDWGFNADELGVPEIEKIDPQCDEDEVPEVKDTITKRGDIWLLGNHRVMCGDSTMIDDVEKLMNGEKADMVFTDPPYKIETDGGFKGEIGKSLRKQASDIEFIADFDPKAFLGVLPLVFNKNKLNAYIFCNKELLPDYLLWARDLGYSFNVLIWKKPNAIPIGDSHRPDIEYLILFRKNAIWNNGLQDVNYSRCLEYGREKGLHPTMKPVELICNEIYISSNKESVVLDFFGGSGSTLIACEKTNRKCYGMELDEHYCDVIVQRWQKYTGKKATLEATGQTYNELLEARNA